jgi:hypothetical protein
LEPVRGLHRLTDWIREKGLRRAAVTNAPRPNAEQMIDTVGLKDFFDHVVVGSECERAKPFPDPYLKGLEQLGVSPENAFAIEVCHNLPAHPNKWLQMIVYRGMRFELVCFTLLLLILEQISGQASSLLWLQLMTCLVSDFVLHPLSACSMLKKGKFVSCRIHHQV